MGLSMNRTQIQVKPDDIVSGRLQVEQLLLVAEKKFGLFDNTPTSRIPNTVRSLVEREGGGFGLGARIVDDLILVDFNPRGDTSQKFHDLYHDMVVELARTFPDKIKEVRENEVSYRSLDPYV
jgi:hypothetical protein